MNLYRRSHGMTALVTTCGLLGLMFVSSGCMQRDASAKNGGPASYAWSPPAIRLPAGTPIEVRLTSTLSSEHLREGADWGGVLTDDVIVDDRVALAAGSVVEGTVTGAIPASRGVRALIDLRIDRIDGRGVHASTEPVIAGSPRARNLGAIAGGAAAGALLGKAVGGDGRDAAIGGLIGGAAATGAVAASKGYQVVLKSGTVMTFTTDTQVAVR